MGAVYLLPGANAIATGDRVKAKLAEIGQRLPDGMEYKIVVDTNDFVLESIHEVLSTLVEAMILVIIVVYVFCRTGGPRSSPASPCPCPSSVLLRASTPSATLLIHLRFSLWCWPSALWWTMPSWCWKTWNAS